jgi:hypothetical protein
MPRRYAMTEEFTAVYRMHSLLPDAFFLPPPPRRRRDPACELRPSRAAACASSTRVPYDDALTDSPPAIPARWCCTTTPNGLRKLHKKDAIFLDIAATDVLRDRERGVPRYCAFRRHLGCACRRASRSSSNTDYSASSPPSTVGRAGRSPGRAALRDGAARLWIFDTAFASSSWMASRRLKSDRFFTTDFTPQVYTPALRLVRTTACAPCWSGTAPQLRPHFADVRNVFPWRM